MSTINIQTAGGYYQLGNAASGSAAVSTAGASLQQHNTLNGFDPSAYLLDLSPEAQKYLNGSLSLSSSNSGFLLNGGQRQAISDIIAKYKDAPFTQDTYNKIQNDLIEAGLGPDQLGRMDKVKSFNPTQLLINALSGRNDNSGAILTDSDIQTKSANYMQQIVSQWKDISTTFGKEEASDAVQAAGGSGGA